jgi:hypothetical protein
MEQSRGNRFNFSSGRMQLKNFPSISCEIDLVMMLLAVISSLICFLIASSFQ